MLNLTVVLTGTTPLFLNNDQGADPDFHLTRELSKITEKRKKTEEDRKQMALLQWYSSLYNSPDIEGPVVPANNVRKMLIETGKIRKLGKDVGRSMMMVDEYVPIVFDGPRDFDKMWSSGNFRDSRITRPQRGRVMKTRCRFNTPWSVSVDCLFRDDILDFDRLEDLVTDAGFVEGFCDARNIGFGRFEGIVKKN